MPCAWDAGSARLFEFVGFEALGTTSGGINWSDGRRDYVYSNDPDEMMEHGRRIVEAADLPVSGDLENGYGAQPEDVGDIIEAAIDAGLVGGSLEDQDFGSAPGLFPLNQAVERIAEAREVADQSTSSFTLTARAESFFGDIDDPFNDAVIRANAYVKAGADCIFVPGVQEIELIARLANEVDAPISVGIGSGGHQLTMAELQDAGVRRVSTGGSIPRLLYAAMATVTEELLTEGTFSFAEHAMDEVVLNQIMRR